MRFVGNTCGNVPHERDWKDDAFSSMLCFRHRIRTRSLKEKAAECFFRGIDGMVIAGRKGLRLERV